MSAVTRRTFLEASAATAALVAELRSSVVPPDNRPDALVIPDHGLAPGPYPPDWTYGDRFMKLIEQGRRPCIVLESRLRDEDYLRSRGIQKLIMLRDVDL